MCDMFLQQTIYIYIVCIYIYIYMKSTLKQHIYNHIKQKIYQSVEKYYTKKQETIKYLKYR